MGVRADAVGARDGAVSAPSDVDDGTPFREAGAEFVVLSQPFAQPIESFGHLLAGRSREGVRPLVDLDPRDRARIGEQLDERRAVCGGLPQRLIEEDDAGDAVAQCIVRPEEQLAIIAPLLLRRLDADTIETLLDCAGTFVGRQDPLALGPDGLRHLHKLLRHVLSSALVRGTTDQVGSTGSSSSVQITGVTGEAAWLKIIFSIAGPGSVVSRCTALKS